jgi:hypothetical protein
LSLTNKKYSDCSSPKWLVSYIIINGSRQDGSLTRVRACVGRFEDATGPSRLLKSVPIVLTAFTNDIY